MIRYDRVPAVAYPDLMRMKTNCFVLDVNGDDPSTTRGATCTMQSIIPYIPVTSPDGQVRKKTIIFGDQGAVEKYRHAIVGRAEEEEPSERLSCFVTQPQDFHAQMENLAIWRNYFDLPHQLIEEGSISNVKEVFQHSQADKRCKMYYANDALRQVTLDINLVALLQEQKG